MDDQANPYESPESTAEQPIDVEMVSTSKDREAYNLVTDTIVGPNIRWKDNLFQAVAIFVCTLLGALIAFLIWRGPGEAIAGAFCGLVFGLFTSGIFLMIYRAIRHLSGRHD